MQLEQRVNTLTLYAWHRRLAWIGSRVPEVYHITRCASDTFTVFVSENLSKTLQPCVKLSASTSARPLIQGDIIKNHRLIHQWLIQLIDMLMRRNLAPVLIVQTLQLIDVCPTRLTDLRIKDMVISNVASAKGENKQRVGTCAYFSHFWHDILAQTSNRKIVWKNNCTLPTWATR